MELFWLSFFFSFHVKFRTRLYLVKYSVLSFSDATKVYKRRGANIFSADRLKLVFIVLTSQDSTQCLIQEVDFSHNLDFSMNIKQKAIQCGTKYHGLHSAWQPCVEKPEFKLSENEELRKVQTIYDHWYQVLGFWKCHHLLFSVVDTWCIETTIVVTCKKNMQICHELSCKPGHSSPHSAPRERLLLQHPN